MPTGITSLSFTTSLILLPSLLASSYEQRQNVTAQKRMLQELQCLPLPKEITSTPQYRLVNTVFLSQTMLAQSQLHPQKFSRYWLGS